jgi:mono/diheme cytochrome c family protein
MRPYLRLTVLLVTPLLFFACQGGTPSYPDLQPSEGFLEDKENIAVGHALYEQHCVRCHGKPEEGGPIEKFDPPAPHFVSDRYAGMDSAYLYWRIEEGKNVEPYLSRGSVMPAWGPHFSEEQIWQLVAYIQKRARH